MELDFLNIRGEPIVPVSAPAKPKAKAEPKQEYHKGWVVEGYAPGRVEEAERLARTDRPPRFWEESVWLNANKPKRVHRPYETLAAAQECGKLAARSGWTHIRITELAKGDPHAFGLF